MSGGKRRQFVLLLVTLVVTQTGLHAARPLISYRTIAMGGGGFEVGIAAAAFAILSVLAAMPLGRFTDRTGRTLTLLVIGTVLCAGAIAGLALAPDLVTVAASSTALGFAHVLLMVGAQGHVAKIATDDELDSGFGWTTAAVSAGQLLGPLLAGFALGSAAVDVGGSARAAGLAAAVAVGAIPVAACLALTSRSGRHAVPQPPKSSERVGSLELMRRPGVASALFTSLALLTAVDILTAYLPLVAHDRGIDATTVGVLLGLRAAASLASRIGIGRLAGRWGHDLLVTASTVGSAVALAAIALPVSSLTVLVPTALIGGFLLGIGQPLTMTLVVRSVPAAARGAALALRLVSNRVGQVVLPTLAAIGTGWLGAAGALWFSAAVLAASGVAHRIDQRPPSSN
ncbi:MFS transporter [Micropruina sp.]|uniref:MFS transporter n=1 Tax=Micropruina sp. TaxID=2737536 RepID=UPI0039E573D6